MVVIEPEPDATETGEATDASHSRSVHAPQGGSYSDEESFEDALTEEQLREVLSHDLFFLTDSFSLSRLFEFFCIVVEIRFF